MSSDSVNFSLLKLFTFGISKSDSEIRLKEGETILLRYWNWRKFGHVRKALTLKDGNVSVQRID